MQIFPIIEIFVFIFRQHLIFNHLIRFVWTINIQIREFYKYKDSKISKGHKKQENIFVDLLRDFVKYLDFRLYNRNEFLQENLILAGTKTNMDVPFLPWSPNGVGCGPKIPRRIQTFPSDLFSSQLGEQTMPDQSFRLSVGIKQPMTDVCRTKKCQYDLLFI